VRWGIGALLAAVVLSGCQERLTAPADCPALCPGGRPQVFEEVFTADSGADTSFVGYVQPHQAPALLVSNGLHGFEERALVRFLSRPDSITVRDTLRGYAIDSVVLNFTLAARDTAVDGLELLVYRIPRLIDSTTTFADVAPAFVPESLIATIGVPDSLISGNIRAVFGAAELGRVQIPAADSGRLAVGVQLAAPTLTGARLSATAGTGANFTTYATLDIPDTGTAKLRTIALGPGFNTSVREVPQVNDSSLLAVGGAPSARSLLRFSLPPRIRDSATIVRATLELTPVEPITGLPTDTARLSARAVLADVGAKSPVSSAQDRVPEEILEIGSTVVSLEAVRLVELWLGATTRPSALMLSLRPEAASFSRPIFHSSRAADPALRPRLRLSYLLSFPFETP
jgi:hypothetical protein